MQHAQSYGPLPSQERGEKLQAPRGAGRGKAPDELTLLSGYLQLDLAERGDAGRFGSAHLGSNPAAVSGPHTVVFGHGPLRVLSEGVTASFSKDGETHRRPTLSCIIHW